MKRPFKLVERNGRWEVEGSKRLRDYHNPIAWLFWQDWFIEVLYFVIWIALFLPAAYAIWWGAGHFHEWLSTIAHQLIPTD